MATFCRFADWHESESGWGVAYSALYRKSSAQAIPLKRCTSCSTSSPHETGSDAVWCDLRRRVLLPVLSRRWAGLLHGPDLAWTEVTIHTEEEFPLEEVPHSVGLLAWFFRRAGSVRSLCIGGDVPKLPATLVAGVMLSLSASLLKLDLSCAATNISCADLAVCLSALTALVA